jgi:hypothetical protein
MDAFIGPLVALGSLIILDLLAIRFGADSREPIGDDWARPPYTGGSLFSRR